MSKTSKKVGILTSNATILPILTIDAVATQPFFYSFCQSKSFSIIPILQATLVFVIILKKKWHIYCDYLNKKHYFYKKINLITF